jgi:hypothetical protein
MNYKVFIQKPFCGKAGIRNAGVICFPYSRSYQDKERYGDLMRENKEKEFVAKGLIKDVPDNFKNWLVSNQDRISIATQKGTLPYWMQDNQRFINSFEAPQNYNIIGKEGKSNALTMNLMLDPLGVNSLISLISFLQNKVSIQIRKLAFENMLKSEQYKRKGDVFFMNGKTPLKHEQQTASKLSKGKDGYYVVFPSGGQIKQIKIIEGDKSKRSNDVYLYDKNTYIQRKAELKTLGNPSVETIAAQISSGSGQASVVVLEITGKISKIDLINGIRSGWTKDTKIILLNYRGQWYEIDKKKVFGDWINVYIK